MCEKAGQLFRAFALALLFALAIGSATEASARNASFVLDLTYGSGLGQVGSVKAGKRDPSEPPLCPGMFQVASDGSIWVVDGINQRVLRFEDGKQTLEISTSAFKDFAKTPQLFGVTQSAVFVVGGTKRDDMPAAVLMRYDRARGSTGNVDLDLPDGRRFSPLRIAPIGTGDNQLLVYGSTWPDGSTATMVVGQDGKAMSVQDGQGIPGADAAVWMLKPSEAETDSELPVTIARYDATAKSWRNVVSAILPKRPKLAVERSKAMLHSVGVDSQGWLVALMFEGRPLSPRFMRISSASGEVQAFALEELGGDSAPLTKFFASEHYQVLPDGSILAQYANSERYRILRISF